MKPLIFAFTFCLFGSVAQAASVQVVYPNHETKTFVKNTDSNLLLPTKTPKLACSLRSVTKNSFHLACTYEAKTAITTLVCNESYDTADLHWINKNNELILVARCDDK